MKSHKLVKKDTSFGKKVANVCKTDKKSEILVKKCHKLVKKVKNVTNQ